MNNFFNGISKVVGKKNVFVTIIAVLVILIVITAAFFILFTPKSLGTGQEATPVESKTDDNLLVINDIYEGQRSIPSFNYPVNTYNMDSFTATNGLITYPESYIGVDLSDHQGVVDWVTVKESGVDFAIIRVGYRGYTRGRLYLDEQFENNIKGATEAGLKIGVYFFSQAVSVAEAEEEAGYVMDKINGYQVDYPVVFDWEPVHDETARTDSVSGEVVSDAAKAFCTKVSKAGYNTAVYMNKSQMYEFYNLDTISNFDIWYAEYQPKPSAYYNFTMWQYSHSATMNGVDTTLDVNISFKDYVK